MDEKFSASALAWLAALGSQIPFKNDAKWWHKSIKCEVWGIKSEPKLLARRKFELILVQGLKSNAKRPRGGEIWTTLDVTSRAIGGSPRVHPRLKSEGSRRSIEQAWRKLEGIPRIPSSETQKRQ